VKHRRRLYTNEGQSESINISPLIDIVFILLIFFIVTTVFVEETGVEVRRPKAVSAAELSRDAVLIAITREGEVVHGGRKIGVRGVRGVVRRALEDASKPVIVQADRSVAVELYAKVHDKARLAGAERVSLATEK